MNAKAMIGRASNRKLGIGQDLDELAVVLDELLAEPRPKVVLEIGVECGASLAVWAELATEDATLIGVDMKPIDPEAIILAGQKLHLVQGISQDEETIAEVKRLLNGREVDLLHIDGEHTLRGVSGDYYAYAQLVRPGGMIIFHDAATNDDVRRFCASIGKGHLICLGAMGSYILRSELSVSIAITTYALPSNIERLLASLGTLDGVPIRVFEDTWAATHGEYVQACLAAGVELYTLPSWGCLQGTAQHAILHSPEDWVVLLSDDVTFTPGAMQEFLGKLRTYSKSSAGLVQIPYWNIYGPDGLMLRPEFQGFDKAPENSHWRQPVPRLYVSVHGSGFALRRKVWELGGGFSPKTWCFDEDLSVKCWLHTPYNVCYFPGKPMLHHGPGAGARPQPEHNYSSTEAWEATWGCSKGEMDKRLRAEMDRAGGDGCPLADAKLREKGLE